MDKQVDHFQRRTATRKKRIEQAEKSLLAEEQRKKRLCEEKESRRHQEEETMRRLEEEDRQRKLEDERKQKELELQQKLEEEAREQEEAERQRRLREEEERKRAEEARIRQMNEDVKQKRLEQIDEIKRLKLAEQNLTTCNNELLLKNDQITNELETAKSNECKLGSKMDALSSRIVSQQVLENDDKQVKFYTGLPSFAVLKAVFDLATKGLPASFFTGCDIFDQFLITLIKLRLNIADQDLAYRFGIVSRCITKWLDVLYVKLSPVIYWPDRDQLLKTMPT